MVKVNESIKRDLIYTLGSIHPNLTFAQCEGVASTLIRDIEAVIKIVKEINSEVPI